MDRLRATTCAATARQYSLENPDTLCPTHTCFDDVGHYVVEICGVMEDGSRPHGDTTHIVRDPALLPRAERLRDPSAYDTLWAVHGIIHVGGEASVHAWCEPPGDLVLELFWRKGEKVAVLHDRPTFYRELQIVDVTRYAPKQLMARWEETDYAGPWVRRYRSRVDEVDTRPQATP